jgi:DNA-binding transcriptional MerR regulator
METHQFYTIGDVAKLTGVPIRTIRYYSLIGLLPPIATTDTRYRLYSPAEIWRLEVIRTLRTFGFGLDEIGKLLAGEISIMQAITLQLTAVTEQIAQLQRVQLVLERARVSAEDADDSLQHLHELGAALNDNAVARRQFLMAKLRATLPNAEPLPYQEQFLQDIAQSLPDTLSSEQATTWAELVELMNDPVFIEITRRQLAPFVEEAQQPDFDLAVGRDQMEQIMEHAVVMAEANTAPNDPHVQAVVTQWLDVFATVLHRPNTPAFAGWFVEHADEFMPPLIERFWTLVGKLNGRQAKLDYRAGQRLLLAGAAWRANQDVASDHAPSSV